MGRAVIDAVIVGLDPTIQRHWPLSLLDARVKPEHDGGVEGGA